MNDLFEKGLQLRREMFGPAGSDQLIAATTDFNRPLEELVTAYCFGEVWARPGLSRKTRSMLTIAMTIALGRQGPVKAHVKGAISNGVSKDEIKEIILHAAIYCGVPAAAEATRWAMEALKEAGVE